MPGKHAKQGAERFCTVRFERQGYSGNAVSDKLNETIYYGDSLQGCARLSTNELAASNNTSILGKLG